MGSIRRRLLATTAFTLLLFGVAIVFAFDRAFNSSAREAEREKLRGLVYVILGAVDLTSEGVLVVREGEIQDPRLFSTETGLVAALFLEGKSEPQWRSPGFLTDAKIPSQLVPVGQWSFHEISEEEGVPTFQTDFGVDWISEDGKSHRFTLVVRERGDVFVRQISEYHRTLARWLLGAALLLVAVWYLTLRWGLHPLGQVASQIGEIRAGKRSALEGNFPEEILPVTDGLNALLRHEHQQQLRYRNSLDDLAHSLKTPLAALHGFASQSEGWERVRPSVVEQIDRVRSIVDHQIRRASMAGRRTFVEPVQIFPAIEKIVSALSKVYREKSPEFDIHASKECVVSVDEGDLLEILGNALDNAAKWSKKIVTVRIEMNENSTSIVVEDDGPGFPKGGRDKLLGRGVRADEKMPGQGIGLAVVHEIVSDYGGKLALSERNGGGARVSIELPTFRLS